MTLPTCCQYHKPAAGCRQGRDCPERTRRIQEAEQRRQTEPIGYEAALPPQFTADKPPRSEEWLAGRAVLIYAGTLLATALAALAVFIKT